MRFWYSLLFYFAMPIILIRLLWKARHHKGYLQHISERFGFIKLPITPQRLIWLHAVSVGEVIASQPIVKGILKEYPEAVLLLTTMTPTGRERAQALFNQQVIHSYLPYDMPFTVKRFIERINPQAVVIMETEIWPNLLTTCRQKNIPVLLANARLSPRSTQHYAKFPTFMKQILSHFSIIAAQGQQDFTRFLEIGANQAQLKITGSIKFDVQISPSAREKAAAFQGLFGNNRLVWVAASTHEGEEELILQAFNHILKTLPHTLLVLVPRHPERFVKVHALCKKMGFETVLRSANQPCNDTTQIFIGDSMGELSAFYAASDVAFVGGSLVPTGGHNLLEPAALSIAAITGPHVFNFAEITELLLAAQAIKMVKDELELADCVIGWLQNSSERLKAGEQGRKVVEKNKGAVEAHLQLLRSLIS